MIFLVLVFSIYLAAVNEDDVITVKTQRKP